MKILLASLASVCFLYALFVRARAGFLKRIIFPWIGLSAFFFVLLLLWDRFPEWLRVLTVLSFLAVFAVYVSEGYRLVKVILDSGKDRPLDYLIVLGAMVYGRRPCDALKKRLDGALKYFALHPKVKIIVTGGQGPDEEYTEAEVMAEYLMDRGVDSPQILREDRAANTAENLKYSSELIDSPKASVGIVSNSFHLYRAMELAKKVGLKNVYPVYARSGLETFPHYFLREITSVTLNDIKKALGIPNGKV